MSFFFTIVVLNNYIAISDNCFSDCLLFNIYLLSSSVYIPLFCFPTVGGNLFDRKPGSFAHSLSFLPSPRPYMTEILLKKKLN